MQHYIFGYGSLISPDSRARTGVTGEATPVAVLGLQRGWILRAPQYGMTALGLFPNSDAVCNGVLIPIAEDQLPRFDKREEGYRRTPVSHASVAGAALASDDSVWAYVDPSPYFRPDEECPLAQTYIDVIISGCMSIGDRLTFAAMLLALTHAWSEHWVNDRDNPRYPRPLTRDADQEGMIDRLLEYAAPAFFSHRQNE